MIAVRILLCVLFAAACGCTKATPRLSKAEAKQRGDAQVAAGNFAQAAASYRLALDADPTDGALRLLLAQTYMSAGDWDAAPREALRAADALPENVEAQTLAARLILLQGRHVDVIGRMGALVRSHPKHVEAHILLGNATARLNSSLWALERLTSTVGQGPTFAVARRNLRPGVAREDDAEAEKQLQEALALAPTMLEARLAMVNLLWALGRPEEGEALLRGICDENPGHAIANFALGAYYLSRKRVEEGERYLRNAANTGAYGRDARMVLADYYISAQRSEDALTLLNGLPEEDDIAGEVSLRMARIEYARGERGPAAARIDALMQRLPNSTAALQQQAEFRASEHNWPETIRLTRAVLSHDPTSSDAHGLLGRALIQTGAIQPGFSELVQAFRLAPDDDRLPVQLAAAAVALGRGEEAVAAARDAKRRQPDSGAAALLLAQALHLVGDHAGAEQELRPLLAKNPGIEVFTLQGRIMVARDNLPAARTAFRRVQSAEADNLDAALGLIEVDLAERRVPDARDAVARLIAARPNLVAAHMLAARVYTAAGDRPRAEESLRRAAALDPHSLSAAVALSDALFASGRGEESAAILEDFLKRVPGAIDAELVLARRLEQLDRASEAMARYQAIVAHSPNSAAARYRLARLMVDRNEGLDVALTLASAARRLAPQDPDAADALGWVYVSKNLPQLSVTHLKDAVKGAPEESLFRYHLGYAYLRLGRSREADQELTTALRLAPQSPFADKIRASIEQVRRNAPQ